MICVNIQICYLFQFLGGHLPYTNQNQSRDSGRIKEQPKASWLTSVIGYVLILAAIWLLSRNEVRILLNVNFQIKLKESEDINTKRTAALDFILLIW
jgi:hypothetical protein